MNPPVSQTDAELRVIEGVVEQRGELRAEAARSNDVLVEREVDDPRSRALDAAFLGVAERAGRRQLELRQIVELRAAAAGVRIPRDVGPPRLAELSDAVQCAPGVGGIDAAGVAVGEIRRQVRSAARLKDRGHRPAADDRVSPQRKAAAERPLTSERNVPRAVHHETVFHDVGIGSAILLDVVGVVLHDADGAVAAVGRVAVGARQRVGGVHREARP